MVQFLCRYKICSSLQWSHYKDASWKLGLLECFTAYKKKLEMACNSLLVFKWMDVRLESIFSNSIRNLFFFRFTLGKTKSHF